MKPTLKYSLISFFALLVVGYLVFVLCAFPGKEKDTVCKLVEIQLSASETPMIGQKDVALLLEQNDLNPMGKTISQISTETIEKTLLKNPSIKRAECFKTPAGIVHIDVYQRIPKLQVLSSENYYIDDERQWMPASLSFSAYVPVVTGRVTKSMAAGRIFDFVTYLEKSPFWNAQIEQIFVRDDLKIELVPRVGEGVILLGRLDSNYVARLEKLRRLYLYGFNKIGWNRYKLIDLQYKDQVVCTRFGKHDEKKPVVEKNDSIISDKL